MRHRTLPLALLIALAACDTSPTAADAPQKNPAFGSGAGEVGPDLSSSIIGTGARTDEDAATTSSAVMGSGNRQENETPDDESGATDSPMMGGGGS
jgi:hypothetical protein